jgi:hypothetical protein
MATSAQGASLAQAAAMSRRQLGGQEPVLLFFILAALLSAAYLFSCLRTGWLPQDDGTLAQAALRVVQGQLPHRDFVENYTGGLSYVHAAAFRAFGTNLFALRLCLFCSFLVWLPAVFFLVSRFTSAVVAAAVTVLAVVWSVPNYPASMPSWYNLFFATFGAAALLRYLELGRRRWLFLAGLCGGVSFLVKVTGLYYVAGVLLFLVFCEQDMSTAAEPEHSRPTPFYGVFLITGLLAFLTTVFCLVRYQFDDREFVHYLLPSAMLAAMLILRNLRTHSLGDRARFLALTRIVWPFVAGVLLPIALFLLPYARSGALSMFWSGVFGHASGAVVGMRRLRPLPTQLIWCVAPLLLLTLIAFWKRAAAAVWGVFVAALLAGLLLISRVPVWIWIWCSAEFLMPVVVTLGAVLLVLCPQFTDNFGPLRQKQLMLMLALAAVCNLVSFPFPPPIYLCYALPLTIFAAVALLSVPKRPANATILASILVFYVVFAVWRVEPKAIYADWMFIRPLPQDKLRLPRAGGIYVQSAEMYENAVNVIRQHAANGMVLATPECPEVYFLSDLRNPTPNDGALAPEEILNAVQTDGLKVVVINVRSTFGSRTLTPEVGTAIRARFPHLVQLDRYWVFWRD